MERMFLISFLTYMVQHNLHIWILDLVWIVDFGLTLNDLE